MLVVLFCVSFVLAVIDANAAGEFTILHSPNSLKFSGATKILESLLEDIISASLGLSVDENTEWKGLYVTDPFNTPEAVVTVYIDGVSSLGYSGGPTKTFPITVDEYELDIYKFLEHRIKQKFPTGGNKVVNVELSNAEELTTKNFMNIFGEIKIAKATRLPLKHLKYSVEEDHQFLNELAPLKAIAAKVWAGVIAPDNIVDFFNFHFRSLHALSDFHGPNSLQTKEAKNLLNETLQELNRAFIKAYGGSVLVTAIVTDVAHKRAVRSPDKPGSISEPSISKNTPSYESSSYRESPRQEEVLDETSSRTSDEFNPDYAAMFNIILWFGVMYFFTMVAIVYTIMNMDPGRDSVIYRMTNPRVKKDN